MRDLSIFYNQITECTVETYRKYRFSHKLTQHIASTHRNCSKNNLRFLNDMSLFFYP